MILMFAKRNISSQTIPSLVITLSVQQGKTKIRVLVMHKYISRLKTYNLYKSNLNYLKDVELSMPTANSVFLRNRIHSFFYKNVVFPAQAEYSYFSADFRLKIFLCYS